MYRVLYVDDEPDLLDIAKLFLEDSGTFSVETLPSAGEAIAHLREHQYDAIISDYEMPGMNGVAFLKTLREGGNKTPFIVFTGRGREEVVIDAINNGADFYLQKGGDPTAQFAELAHKIRQAVGRKEAECALAKSEKRLADIINFLPDATFAIDTEGKVIAWNLAMAGITGVPSTDILGKGNSEHGQAFYQDRRPMLADLVLKSDDVVEKEKYTKVHREGRVLTAETILKKPDGTEVYYWGKASPLFEEHGNLAGAIETIRDISIRKRLKNELEKKHEDLNRSYEQLTATEEELRQQYEELSSTERQVRDSEIKYRTLVEVIRDIVYAFDADGIIRYMSPQTTDQIGFTPEEMIGKSYTEFIHTDDVPRLIANVEKYKHLGTHFSSDTFRVLCKDGSFIWFEDNTIFTKDPHGIPIFIGTMRDITERKNAEDTIFESRQMLQLVLDNIPQRVFWKDTNLVFLGCNKPLANDVGYADPAEMIGKTDYDHSSASIAEHFREDDRQVIETGVAKINFEEQQIRPDGSTAWLRTSKVPLKSRDGKTIGILGTYEDITDEKKLRLNLLESEKIYREFFKTTRDAVFFLNPDTTYLDCNDAYLRHLRVDSIESLRNLTPERFIEDPDDWQTIRQILRTKRYLEEFPLVFRRSDGTKGETLASVTPLKNPDGSIKVYIGIVRDIS